MHEHAIIPFIMNKRTLELTRLHSGLVGLMGTHIPMSRTGRGVLHLFLQNLTAELMRVAKGRGFVLTCGQTKETFSHYLSWRTAESTFLRFHLHFILRSADETKENVQKCFRSLGHIIQSQSVRFGKCSLLQKGYAAVERSQVHLFKHSAVGNV